MSQSVEITHPDGRKTLKPLKGATQRANAVDVLIEALKAKGAVTAADLAAAEATLHARRSTPAAAGKQPG